MARIGRRAFIFVSLVLAMAVGWLANDAHAQSATRVRGNICDGEYIATFCTSTAETHRETCRANVITVAHAMAHNHIEGFRACLPPMTGTWGGITAAVTRWLYDNPDSWGLSVVGVIAAALSKTYPYPG